MVHSSEPGRCANYPSPATNSITIMELYNDTLLGSFLAHMQSQVRRLAALHFEQSQHPDYDSETAYDGNPALAEMRAQWEIIRKDLSDVCQLPLVPFNQLARPGKVGDGPAFLLTHDVHSGGRDPLRYSFKALKKIMDKARRKNPGIKMLRSWDVAAKERFTPDEKEDRDFNRRYFGYASL